MFAGGEFYYEDAWRVETPAIDTAGMYFLNGGAACLTVISDFLRDQGIARVLLPEYLCPSILHTLERCGMGWDFYGVNEDFSIDLDDLARKAAGARAVYFINYFGFFHSAETQAFFKQLQQGGVLVIEDNAQAGFVDAPLGDFTLNSMRKLAAYDGGYLRTRFAMQGYIDRHRGIENRRLPLIRAYRAGLYRYLFDRTGSFAELTDLHQRATDYYASDPVVAGDADERSAIERLDWAGIKQARRANYAYLMAWVRAVPEVGVIFPELQADNMPMGLPVYFKGVARDAVDAALGKAGVGLTIHWDEIRTDPRTRGNARAAAMAGKILTLAIDQRMRKKQLDFMAMELIRGIEAAKGE